MSSIYYLNDSVSSIKGVGPATVDKLTKLGIETVRDLLHHFPTKYYDFTSPVTISRLEEGKVQVFNAILEKPYSTVTGTKKLLTQVMASDTTGKVCLTWFNNPYIKSLIKENILYTIAGKSSFWGKKLIIIAPLIEPATESSLNTHGLVPIYPQTAGLSSKQLRTKIFFIINNSDIKDPLDEKILNIHCLVSQKIAYSQIHFPKNTQDRWHADKRLSFNEHLRISLVNQIELLNLGKSIPIKSSLIIDKKSKEHTPFKLTKDQEKTISSIYKDLNKDAFTHRLIQGDTGSGKTVTLIYAANQCLAQNYSCAIMAPTEILANQHYKTYKTLGLFPDLAQIISSSSKETLDTSKPHLYIGTHALITQIPKKLKFPLVFLGIDEQHKFGVKQRDELIKRQPVPHLFNLSATPIPRTVALGLLGDIQISNINHQPKNRLPTKTFVITPTRFKNSPNWLIKKLDEGNQIFVVCPNITEHDENIASIEKIVQLYRKIIPEKYSVTSIHGKMKSEEQNKILNKFKNKSTGILVATSLIEVGIDIPSANIMIIHSAERFGLAALHQLRGRVGRGAGQGYCFLVPSNDDDEQKERLQLLKKYHSGLILAQKDLKLRGAGEVFGIKQHGSLSTKLKYFWSKKLFLLAKNTALMIIKKDPKLALQIATKLTTC
jgi:ATP-dependent DNA helicase RecG